LGTRTATFNLEAGETVKCTFTNVERGTIIVEKQTTPDGATGDFTFTGDAAGTISDNGTIEVNDLVPGTYTATESDPTPGFDLTSISCDDVNSSGDLGTRTATFNLEAGETVKCTFTNVERGKIIVNKTTIPAGDPETFGFTAGYGNFSLSDGSSNDSGWLVPGTYSVVETVPDGWDLTSATCDEGSDPSSIELDPGETVTCDFENSRLYKIIVFVCTEGTPELVVSEVSDDGGVTSKLTQAETDSLAASICGYDASFGGLYWDSVTTLTVGIPTLPDGAE
jgi:hypothetical protein